MELSKLFVLLKLFEVAGMASATLKVESYNPDVEIWESCEERIIMGVFLANGVTYDKKKVFYFLSSMVAKGNGLSKNLISPDKQSTKKFSDICKTLKDYCGPRPPVWLGAFCLQPFTNCLRVSYQLPRRPEETGWHL